MKGNWKQNGDPKLYVGKADPDRSAHLFTRMGGADVKCLSTGGTA